MDGTRSPRAKTTERRRGKTGADQNGSYPRTIKEERRADDGGGVAVGSGPRFRGLLESLPDAVVVVNSDGDILLVNAQTEGLFGYRREEIIGQSIRTVAPVGFRARRTDGGLDLYGRHKDGTEFPVDIRLSPMQTEDGILVTAVIRDISERKRVEAELRRETARVRLLQAITFAANEAATIDAAVQFAVDRVCDYTGWPIGHAYAVNSLGVLAHTAIWHLRDPQLDMFRQVTEACDFTPGIGLPGWVLATGRPAWVKDITRQPEFEGGRLAELIGVKAGFAFPILLGTEVIAVLEFFACEAVEADEQLLEVMTDVGTQLGRVVERQRAEEAQQKASEEIRDLYNNAPCGYHSLDMDGTFIQINDTELAWLGYTRDEVVGKMRFSDVLTLDTRKAFWKDFASFKQRGWVRELEFELVRKDRTTFPVLLSATTIEDDAGNYLMSRSTTFDITERKGAEQALRANEERTRSIIERAYDAFIAIDTEGLITEWNPQADATFGWSREETLGRSLTDTIIPQRYRKAHARGLEHFLATGEGPVLNKRIQITALHRDGHEIPVELTISPVRIGETYVFNAFIQDITERKRAEEELRRAHDELEERVQERTRELSKSNALLRREIGERKRAEEALALRAEELARSNAELEQFAYIASHDLKEPLRVVASYLQLLKERYESRLDSDADDFIAFAVEGAVRMQSLIDGLLAYSRVGTHGKSFQPTNTKTVLDRALANLEAAVQESGAIVTHGVALPTVIADPTQLEQLFQNLIANAIKFRGDKRPEVRIAAKRHRDEWLFSVSDNGIGIEPQYAERIFAIFQRLHRRRQYPGTGIGLAICKKIVERHGGRIWVESRPAKGSVFRFTIPNGGGHT